MVLQRPVSAEVRGQRGQLKLYRRLQRILQPWQIALLRFHEVYNFQVHGISFNGPVD
jgi:hypothetical protein